MALRRGRDSGAIEYLDQALPAAELPVPVAYDRVVATATPSSTPNPDATKFTLDTTLTAMFNATNAEQAMAIAFARDVFAAGGVASVFGVNDFVTVTRQPGADWEPIIAAVHDAAAAHL